MKKPDKDYINTAVLDILEILRHKRISQMDRERICAKVVEIRQTVYDSK